MANFWNQPLPPHEDNTTTLDDHKLDIRREWRKSYELLVKISDEHPLNFQTRDLFPKLSFDLEVMIKRHLSTDNVEYLSVEFMVDDDVDPTADRPRNRDLTQNDTFILSVTVGLINTSGQFVKSKRWSLPQSPSSKVWFGWPEFIEKSEALDQEKQLLEDSCLKFWFEIKVMDKRIEEHEIQSIVDTDAKTGFESLENDKSLTDFTLVVDDQEFAAHRTVLALRSPVFKSMVTTDMKEKRESRAVLSNVDKEVFERVLKFIYTANVDTMTEPMAHELIKAADYFQIDGLKDAIAQSLFGQLTTDNLFAAIEFGRKYTINGLMKNAFNFIADYREELVRSVAENTNH